ncbi:MAG: hypothetical protein RLZ12_614 [Bacillota bacterium]|jgi:hypothetical protein
MNRLQDSLNSWMRDFTIFPNLTKQELFDFWSVLDQPHDKRVATVLSYKEKFNLKVLIEGGTYKGEMIKKTLDVFDKIISIECDEKLATEAQKKFQQHNHVRVIHGGTEDVLPLILKDLDTPALFWLDSHYIDWGLPIPCIMGRTNTDCPIMIELTTILHHPVRDHVILIDDARCFTGPNVYSKDYPSIQELKKFVQDIRPDMTFEYTPPNTDIIAIYKEKK